MRGHLKLMILNALEKDPLSGSEIMQNFEANVGWKPSCGSLYPVLQQIVSEKLAIVKQRDRSRKIYAITRKGKSVLNEYHNNKENLLKEIVKIHRMIESTYGVDLKISEKSLSEDIKIQLKTGGIVLRHFAKETENLKKEFTALMSSGQAEKNIAEVKRILNMAALALKELRNDAEANKARR